MRPNLRTLNMSSVRCLRRPSEVPLKELSWSLPMTRFLLWPIRRHSAARRLEPLSPRPVLFSPRGQTHLLKPGATELGLDAQTQLRRHSTDSKAPRYHYKAASTRFWKSFERYLIPLTLGLVSVVAYKRYAYVRRREQAKMSPDQQKYQQILASGIEVSFLKMLPLRLVSRWWGWINSVTLPVFMRPYLIGAYSRAFGCSLEEAQLEKIEDYPNLSEFFRRSLKPEARPIADGPVIVSPSDGTVLHLGRIEDGRVEQVKGVNYSLGSFFGPQTWNVTKRNAEEDEYHQELTTKNDNTSLYHCVIYLAPGDYHRFHSPTQWTVNFRRHFPGTLLSVRPSFISWIEGLFHLNERVVYVGQWVHGFFSMTAVGATNVGCVKVYFDQDLYTNKWRKGVFLDKYFSEVKVEKGNPFGEFNLGSTIVLIFEAPNDLKFDVSCGKKVKYGQKLYTYNNCLEVNEKKIEAKG